MATKLELAESMTVEQLRAFAAENGIDLTGLSVKADIAEAVASGSTLAALQAATSEPSDEGGAMAEEEEGLGDAPEEQEVREAQSQAENQVSPIDTEAQAEAGQSAADRELSYAPVASGEPQIVKASPETPTLEQVEAATTEQPSPPDVTVMVTDVEGNEEEAKVRPDDAARISQGVAASNRNHPVNNAKGHGGQRTSEAWTEEEIEQNEENYASRIS